MLLILATYTSSSSVFQLSIPSRMLRRPVALNPPSPPLSIPSRMLRGTTPLDAVEKAADFQFLLGCFLPRLGILMLSDFRLSIPSRMLPLMTYRVCKTLLFELSIPSRMLLTGAEGKTRSLSLPFQFLLGCFAHEETAQAEAREEDFQFLLGCFNYFKRDIILTTFFQFLLGCFQFHIFHHI